jgi:hypothetical protein
MRCLAPDLPDAVVAIAPVLGDVVGDPRDLLAGIAVEPAALPRVDRHRLEHCAVEVELNLVGRAVADPDRRRAAVAGQLRYLELIRVHRAVDPVEDLQARLRQSRGVHQPPEEGVRLVVEAEPEHRIQRPGRVAQPREAVVPVPLAADPLR